MKIFKIIIINIIILYTILFTFNVIYWLRINATYHNTSFWGLRNFHYDELVPFTIKIKTFDAFYNSRKDSMFRPIEGQEYEDKIPVILLGCSFAYGHVLPDNKILSAKLAQKAHRKIYNFAYPGWGVQEILYLFKNNETLKNITIPEEEGGKQYLIYWYISDHLRRMYHEFDQSSIYYYLTYQNINGNLSPIHQKHPFLDAYFIYKDYRFKVMVDEYAQLTDEEKYPFFNLHLAKILEEKNKLFPNAEFILMSSSEPFPEEETQLLDDMGIRVMYTQDLTGVDMENDPEWTYDIHPNAAAVELLSDALVKELDL